MLKRLLRWLLRWLLRRLGFLYRLARSALSAKQIAVA